MAASGVFLGGSPITVLFVDDDLDTRLVYQSLAESEGFVAEVAADGYEAIVLANLLRPDVIVLDWRLPVLDGREVVRRLRGNDYTRVIPIIIVSGDCSLDVERHVKESGCEAHLLKPCSVDTLLGLLIDLGTRRRGGPRALAGSDR